VSIDTNASESAAAEPGSIFDAGCPLLVAGMGGALAESLSDDDDNSGGSEKCSTVMP
jgi:hypothetical protein